MSDERRKLIRNNSLHGVWKKHDGVVPKPLRLSGAIFKSLEYASRQCTSVPGRPLSRRAAGSRSSVSRHGDSDYTGRAGSPHKRHESSPAPAEDLRCLGSAPVQGWRRFIARRRRALRARLPAPAGAQRRPASGPLSASRSALAPASGSGCAQRAHCDETSSSARPKGAPLRSVLPTSTARLGRARGQRVLRGDLWNLHGKLLRAR